MTQISVRALIVALAALAPLSTRETVAQSAPNATPAAPELVAPGVISGSSVYVGQFTPDGDTLYFFRKVGAGEDYRIFRSARRGTRWQAAEQVELGGDFSDLYPTISADGQRMVFVSYRPVPGHPDQHPQGHLWMTERAGSRWGPPRFLADVTRLGYYHSHPTLRADGRLRFARQGSTYRNKVLLDARWGRDGSVRVDTAEVWTNWQQRVRNGEQIHDVEESPDGRYVILVIGARSAASPTGDPADLYIASRRAGGWSEPQRLGGGVSSPGFDNFPFWSPDGRDFYFIRDFRNLYRVPVSALPLAR